MKNNRNSEYGSWLHGVGATEDLDSSGERIKIEGIDISSLTTEGVFNYEHKSDEPNQVIGKILEAKKIFKKEDCENEHHEYFWEIVGKKPYLYVAGILFDKFNHTGANDIAAMLNFDSILDTDKTRRTINFSIEGSRLDKKGVWINKCVARKITITHLSCNKRCPAELLKDPSHIKGLKQESLLDIFKKYENTDINLKKAIDKYTNKLAFKLNPKQPKTFKPVTNTTGQHKQPQQFKPKRTMESTSITPKTDLNVGDRINYKDQKPKTGKDIYSDPQTWKSEKKKMSKFYSSNVRKALIASCGVGVPSTKTGSPAISKNEKNQIFRSLSDEAFERFDKKEELIQFLSERLSNFKKNEILALAKTIAYCSERRSEGKLQKLMEKARVDIGLNIAEKKKARSQRKEGFKPHEKEKWTKPTEEGEKFRTAKLKPKKTKEERKKKVLESKAKRGDVSLPSEKDLEYPDKLAASEEEKRERNNG